MVITKLSVLFWSRRQNFDYRSSCRAEAKEKIILSTRVLIRFKTAAEFMDRAAWQDGLDSSRYKLKEIIGDYSFARKDQLPCGLKNCRTKHQNGYVVVTEQGPETHIGNRCGKKYFDVNWGEVKAEYNRAKERKEQEEWLQGVLARRVPLLALAKRLLQALYDANAELVRVLSIINQERDLSAALVEAAKRGGALEIEEEVDEEVRKAMRLKPNQRFRTIKLGQLLGIEAAVPPRGDTRLRGQAAADRLRVGDIPSLEALSAESLRNLNARARKAQVTQLDGMQTRLSDAEKLIAQTRRFTSPANLRELGKLPVRNRWGRVADILTTFANTPDK